MGIQRFPAIFFKSLLYVWNCVRHLERKDKNMPPSLHCGPPEASVLCVLNKSILLGWWILLSPSLNIQEYNHVRERNYYWISWILFGRMSKGPSVCGRALKSPRVVKDPQPRWRFSSGGFSYDRRGEWCRERKINQDSWHITEIEQNGRNDKGQVKIFSERTLCFSIVLEAEDTVIN